MDEKKDSAVMHELEVRIAQNVGDQLYNLQFLNRAAHQPLDYSKVEEAKSKPENMKMELTFALDTCKSSYDPERAKQFAVNSKGVMGRYFNSDYTDRQTFKTTYTEKGNGKYAIGFIKDGVLHLTMVTAILQLHASFDYLDADDKSSIDESALPKENEEATPVTVKFSRPETERARKAREKSYSYYLKKLEEEPWMNLPFHPVDSEHSRKRRSQLVGRSDELVGKPNMMAEFSHSLLTCSSAKEQNRTSVNSSADSTLNSRIQSLMLKVKWAFFSELMKHLGRNVDPIATIRALQNIAVLIRGCWVVKSEVIYPKNSISPLTGISAELLCRVRDLILWHYTQSVCISRSSIDSVIKIPNDDLVDILKSISNYEANKGWILAFTVDEMFEKQYPEVMQRQKLLWDAKYASLAKILKLRSKPNDFNLVHPPFQIKQENVEKLDSESECSGISQSTTVVKMEVDSDNGVVATSTFDTELSNFVSERLAFSKVITISELRRHLNQKLAQSAPGHILCSGVTDASLKQALNEARAVCVSQTWAPAAASESIYAAVNFGDGTEKLRRFFLGLFQENPKQRKTGIKKGMEKAFGRPLNEEEFILLQKDYCLPPKKGCYHMKYSNVI
ncbi:DNA-directed RNA polymerase III subunit RPC5 [Chamberlinius hualienensis]